MGQSKGSEWGGVQTEHPDLSDGCTERPSALRPELALGKALRAPRRAQPGFGSPGRSECLLSGLAFFPRWLGGPGDNRKAPRAVSPGGHTGCDSVAGCGGGLRVPTAPSGAEGFLAWLWYRETHGVGCGKPGPQDLYFLSVKKSLRSLSGLCVRPAALLLAAVTCS